MGVRNDEILAILNDDQLTQQEKAAQIQIVKRDEANLRLPPNVLPYVVNLDASREVTLLDDGSLDIGLTPSGSAYAQVNVSFKRDGVEEYNGLWKVVNPPLLIPDPDGPADVALSDGINYKEDFLEVLRVLLDRRFP